MKYNLFLPILMSCFVIGCGENSIHVLRTGQPRKVVLRRLHDCFPKATMVGVYGHGFTSSELWALSSEHDGPAILMEFSEADECALSLGSFETPKLGVYMGVFRKVRPAYEGELDPGQIVRAGMLYKEAAGILSQNGAYCIDASMLLWFKGKQSFLFATRDPFFYVLLSIEPSSSLDARNDWESRKVAGVHILALDANKVLLKDDRFVLSYKEYVVDPSHWSSEK